MSRVDPDVAYAQMVAHDYTCATCRTNAPRCDTGRALLTRWGDAALLADRQAAEADAGFALDDEYTAHPEDQREAKA